MTSQACMTVTGTTAARLKLADGGLATHEYYWRDRQPWLKKQGYMLRARYKPDWKPSWLGTAKYYRDCEDGLSTFWRTVLDARRLSDGLPVMLKVIDTVIHPFEVGIGRYLFSEQLLHNPRNHCVHMLEVLQDPIDIKKSIIVMPLLKRFGNPEVHTFGEVVAFFKQAIEGLHFMHDHHVAHRDISILNVMMDATPMYSKGLWHPVSAVYNRRFTGGAEHSSRTERPIKYFYIDFGLSRRYDPADGPPRELPIRGGDKSVPEFQEDGYDVASDPFRTDIYYLGNLMRTTFFEEYRGFGFMKQLVADMVQDDPEKRPTIAEVGTRFDKICRRCSWWKLRTRLVTKEETSLVRVVLSTMHFFWTAKLVAKRLPSVPIPSP